MHLCASGPKDSWIAGTFLYFSRYSEIAVRNSSVPAGNVGHCISVHSS